MKHLIALAVLAFATTAAAQEPKSLTLHFDFFYNNIPAAKVVETFTIEEDGGYVINSHAKASGLAKLLYGDVIRKSRGRIDEVLGLLPLHFETKRGKRPKNTMVFDEDAGVLHLQRGEETRSEPVPEAPLVDYLTAIYRPYILQTLTPGMVAATDGWRIKTYEYIAGEMEKIKTPMGEFDAVPLIRESERGNRVFWLAPEMDYIPIKVHIDDKGHVFKSVLTAVNP